MVIEETEEMKRMDEINEECEEELENYESDFLGISDDWNEPNYFD